MGVALFKLVSTAKVTGAGAFGSVTGTETTVLKLSGWPGCRSHPPHREQSVKTAMLLRLEPWTEATMVPSFPASG